MTGAALRWGILGTGIMAQRFADALAHSNTGALQCAGTRGAAQGGGGSLFCGAEVISGYENLLARADVDAVYLALPHTAHAEWVAKAALGGKHILCEKPVALNADEARRIFAAAARSNVLAVEAFMYRMHPQTAELVELVRAGRIGRPRMMTASYGYRKAYDPSSRNFSSELGGGAILDIGCYCASLSRMIAGAAIGQPFADPVSVVGIGSLAGTGVDESASALLQFKSGLSATVSCSMTTRLDNRVQVFGDDGWIEVMSPWLTNQRQGGESIMRVHAGSSIEEIPISTSKWLYALTIDAFAESVRAGRPLELLTRPDDSIGNMRTLDLWRAELGVTYPSEGKPE